MAGAGRFDGGVEREQGGLEGNAADQRHDLLDVLGLGIEHLDVLSVMGDLLAHGVEIGAGLAQILIGFAGRGDTVRGGGAHLLGVPGNIQMRRLRLLAADENVVGQTVLFAGVAGGGLDFSRQAHRVGGDGHPHLADRQDGFPQFAQKQVEVINQVPEFVVGAGHHVFREIPFFAAHAAEMVAHAPDRQDEKKAQKTESEDERRHRNAEDQGAFQHRSLKQGVQKDGRVRREFRGGQSLTHLAEIIPGQHQRHS